MRRSTCSIPLNALASRMPWTTRFVERSHPMTGIENSRSPSDGGFSGTFIPGDAIQPAHLEVTPTTRRPRTPGQFEAGHRSDASRPANPWHDVNGTKLAWAGEIHNAAALRQQLQMPTDAPLASVLAAAWRRWGGDCLPRLDGVLAFALQAGDELLLYSRPVRTEQAVLPRCPGRARQLCHTDATHCLAGQASSGECHASRSTNISASWTSPHRIRFSRACRHWRRGNC